MQEGQPLPYEMRCILFVGEDTILPLKLVAGNMRTVEDTGPTVWYIVDCWVGLCVTGIMIVSAGVNPRPTVLVVLCVDWFGNVVIDTFGAVVSVFERKLCRNIA